MTVLHANAKLTLSLRITGRRDDGFHLIDAEMVTLDLHDTLEISDGDGLELIDETGPKGDLGVAHGADNLVQRALRATGRTAHVRLTKRIPLGAGLGGGSADAAAVLRWAGIDDPATAVALGADVPFCVVGGRARVRGIGEIVEPLALEPRVYTLMVPPFGCSTPEVYRAWDELGAASAPTGASGEPGNDLEPAALRVQPRLADWREHLAGATGQRPRLAGSGSTWFVEGEFPGEGRIVTRSV